MASSKTYILLGVADVFLLAGLVFSIFYLRKKHPAHVFTIWYAFWLMFTLFSGLFYYVWANARAMHVSPLGGGSILGQLVIWFQAASMKFSEEGYLIAAIYIAVVIPQFMAYLVSGIFGCAKRAVLIEWITAAMTWLVIKFLAVLSAILMAQAVASLYADPLLKPVAFPLKLLESIMMISLSFVIAAVFYFTYGFRARKLIVQARNLFEPFTHFMTRYTASEEAREAKKQRYAWLRRRLRELTTVAVVELTQIIREHMPIGTIARR